MPCPPGPITMGEIRSKSWRKRAALAEAAWNQTRPHVEALFEAAVPALREPLRGAFEQCFGDHAARALPASPRPYAEDLPTAGAEQEVWLSACRDVLNHNEVALCRVRTLAIRLADATPVLPERVVFHQRLVEAHRVHREAERTELRKNLLKVLRRENHRSVNKLLSYVEVLTETVERITAISEHTLLRDRNCLEGVWDRVSAEARQRAQD